MYAEETVAVGTPVTVTESVEFVSESLQLGINYQDSRGIAAGRRYGGTGRRETSRGAGGTITSEVPYIGYEKFYEMLLGDVVTTQPDVGLAPTVFLHTFSPGSLTGLSMTIQKGVEDSGGTVRPFTYNGCKVVSADFKIGADELLMVDWEIDAWNEITGTALATYTAPEPTIFAYSEGGVYKDDVLLASVRSVPSLKITNNLRTERRFLGGSGIKAEQINRPLDSITAALDVEFQNLTDFHTPFTADTDLKLELEFIGPVIEDVQTYIFRVTVNNFHFTGDTPTVSDTELVYTNVPGVGLDHASLDAVTIELQNTTVSV
jgi:hypothetical protein